MTIKQYKYVTVTGENKRDCEWREENLMDAGYEPCMKPKGKHVYFGCVDEDVDMYSFWRKEMTEDELKPVEYITIANMDLEGVE